MVFTASASSRSFPGFGRFQGWTCHVYATSPADAVDLAAGPFDPENLPTSVKNAVMSKLMSSDVEEASSTALAAVRVKAFETKNATQKWLSEGARATELRQTLSESEMAVIRCPKKGSILIRRNTLSTGTDIY